MSALAEAPLPLAAKRVMNISNFLRQTARRYGTSNGLIWGERAWTWREIDTRVDALAWALRSRGVSAGDRVLVHSRNCNQLLESMFACFRIGAVWVPTNWRLTPREIAVISGSSSPSAIICQNEFPEHAIAARSCAAGIGEIISIGGGAFGKPLDELVERNLGRRVDDAPVDYNHPCWFFYTSGTTGVPKAAVLTHGQMTFVITNHIADLMPTLCHSDSSVVVAPLTHGAGVHLLSQVARGAKTVLPTQDRLDPAEIWALIEQWHVTNFFAVPTIVKLLTEHAAVDQYDHSSLRQVIYAGAPMYRADQQLALRKLGRVLVQYYGLGEVTGAITVLPSGYHEIDDHASGHIGSCGYERTGMQVAILDASGREQPVGESGEICVCGPAVFAGYYNDPDANSRAFRDGWFRTGDVGFMDIEGFLYITGRLSDMYISGGSNIYPREVEEQLLGHPAIHEATVLGVPDPVWGEVGVAVVVRKAGVSCGEEELLEFLGDRIARYKLPKRIYFWDELPKSGYGKISKRLIREKLGAVDLGSS